MRGAMLHVLVLGASALEIEFQTSGEAPIFLLEGAQPAPMLEAFGMPMPEIGELVAMVNQMNQQPSQPMPRRPTNPCEQVRRAAMPPVPPPRCPHPGASAASTPPSSLGKNARPHPPGAAPQRVHPSTLPLTSSPLPPACRTR